MVVVGVWAWSWAAPNDPMGLVRTSNMSLANQVLLIGVAGLLGFVCYYLAWPYGFEVGVLAVPAGLAVWASRSGSVASLLQAFPSAEQRVNVFSGLRWDAFYWVLVVFAGIGGAYVARKLSPSPSLPIKEAYDAPKLPASIGPVVAVLASLLVAQLLLNGFSQDVRVTNEMIASQPVTRQAAFATMIAFGGAAYLVRHFFNVSYIWSLLAAPLLYCLGTFVHTRTTVLAGLAEQYPAICLSNALFGIIPIQLISFGSIGAVIGYWLAIRYRYWRNHECS
jgi:hypothetical protein